MTYGTEGDVLLALAAGCAGTLAFTRGLSGAVIGVMVAVALVPPLVGAGLLLGEPALAFGAMLLMGANVICINLAGIGTFLLQGVRPRHWADTERAKSGMIKALHSVDDPARPADGDPVAQPAIELPQPGMPRTPPASVPSTLAADLPAQRSAVGILI